MEATKLHLSGSLEPQLRLSVALCEMAHPRFPVLRLRLLVVEEIVSGRWREEAVEKESGRRYRGDAHVGVLRMLLLR
jgi:hypothetical protein